MTFYRLEKKLPNLGIALSKRVIEYCDTGNDCATKIKTTTSLMKLSLTLRKVPTCKQLWKSKWLWVSELGKWIMKGERPRPMSWIPILNLLVHIKHIVYGLPFPLQAKRSRNWLLVIVFFLIPSKWLIHFCRTGDSKLYTVNCWTKFSILNFSLDRCTELNYNSSKIKWMCAVGCRSQVYHGENNTHKMKEHKFWNKAES